MSSDDEVDAFIQHAKLFRARIPHARQGWIQIFLRSVEGGTSVFGMDQASHPCFSESFDTDKA